MAPLKPEHLRRYREAAEGLLRAVDDPAHLLSDSLEKISDFKGMVNRCARQDQWDWFTVYSLFGEPNPRPLWFLGHALQTFRLSLKNDDRPEIERSRLAVVSLGALFLAHRFLETEHVTPPYAPTSGGWIYVLSTREQPTLLKIGMTMRSVTERVREINSATGVLFPYSVRRVFKVKDARLAEKEVFTQLQGCRVRSDREFFHIPFLDAVKLIEAHLANEGHMVRHTGSVKWFSAERRYGFITDSNGKDYFFHGSESSSSEQLYEPGTHVEFDESLSDKGRLAKGVIVLQ